VDPSFRYLVGMRLVFTDDTPDIVAYPTDRAAYGRLCQLLTTGNRRALKGECYLHFDDLEAFAEGQLFIFMSPMGTVIPGLSDKSVRPLIDLGQLVKTEELSPTARRAVPVVTRLSAEEFHRRYVTAGELCQTHGLHHKQVKSILTGAGIELAFDQDAVRSMIYDRAAVEKAEARREGFWGP
jgi:hypothetical protein